MITLRQKMIEDMQLRGLSARTQETYAPTVSQLAKHYHKSPDQIDEEELRQYFLYLMNVKHAARNTCTIALCGIKFFYEHTLERQWHFLEFVRPAKEKKLPVVLSVQEVAAILACVHVQHYRVCLTIIYACGLRLLEGVHLQVKNIDSARTMLHICQGKGGKDRYAVSHRRATVARGTNGVPLPEASLGMLRLHWLTHRNRVWLFPALRTGQSPEHANEPMNESSMQKAFRAALRESGIHKNATVHTLRQRAAYL